MTIQLPDNLERSLRTLVRGGQYASVDEAMAEAARLLLRQQPPQASMTEAEFDQYLLDTGLVSQLPDTAADFDDPDDQPVDIEGEPLSETVLRDRR